MTVVGQAAPGASTAPVDQSLSGSAQALLRAVMAISGDLDLRSVLLRLVEAAAELTSARYGALGVIGGDGSLSEFITTGLDERQREQIGNLPHGDGILGLLIEDPRPLRLKDLNTHPSSTGMPPNHPPMRSFLGVPIRIRGTVFGNLYLTEKSEGRTFTDQDEELVQTLANAAALVIENARAYGLSERRRRWLEASADLGDALQPPITLDEALEAIAVRSRAAARALAAAVVQFPVGHHPVISAHDGPADTDVTDIVRAVIDEARIADQQSVVLEVDLHGRHALVLPLRAHLADPGVLLIVFDRALGTAEPEDREFLGAFADQAGLAVDRAQAFSDREELAVVSERARIARDLHDVVIQRLFAAGLRLESFRKTPRLDEVDAALGGVVKELDLTIRDIRTSIFGLQQQTQDTLRSEIHALLTEYTSVLGFAPALRTHGPIDLLVPENVAEHLLAVLREALSNVARHAHARDAAVEIATSTDEVVLRVIDGGIGIPEHRVESGLKNARERAALLGGVLEITPNVGPGTTLTWRAPLNRPRTD